VVYWDDWSAVKIGELVDRIFVFLAEFHGICPPLKLAVVPRSSVGGVSWMPQGAVMAVDAGDILVLEQPLSYRDFHTTMRVASLWWGIGWKLTGQYAEETQQAICAVLGMRWLRQIRKLSMLDEMHRYYQKLRGMGRLRRHFWVTRGYPDPAVVADLVIRLDAAFRDSPQLIGAIRSFLLSKWGTTVAVGEFMSICESMHDLRSLPRLSGHGIE
jgi:hypothetical protein